MTSIFELFSEIGDTFMTGFIYFHKKSLFSNLIKSASILIPISQMPEPFDEGSDLRQRTSVVIGPSHNVNEGVILVLLDVVIRRQTFDFVVLFQTIVWVSKLSIV